MNLCWKLSPTESDVAEVEITVTATQDGWCGVLVGNGATATAASVNEVRTILAGTVMEQIKNWTEGNGVGGQIDRIRLFTHLRTEHQRVGAHAGEIIDVAALADRVPGGWVARTLMGHLALSPGERERRLILEVLSGTSASHTQATGETFMEAQETLAALVMQELDLGADQTYPDWSALRLTVTTRKTFETATLA